jgi:hypothetical protein
MEASSCTRSFAPWAIHEIKIQCFNSEVLDMQLISLWNILPDILKHLLFTFI